MSDMPWKEPLKRVESTLTEKINGVNKRLERNEADLDDMRKQLRDLIYENRTWMQTLTDKLDRRHEDMQAQNDNMRSLVDKLAVIEARNSKDLENLTANVSVMNGAVSKMTVLVEELTECSDTTSKKVEQLELYRAKEEGEEEATEIIKDKIYQKKEFWIGSIVGVGGLIFGIVQAFLGG